MIKLDFKNSLAYRIYPVYSWLAIHGAPEKILDMFIPILCNIFKIKNSTKRIITYRVLSVFTEFMIVFLVTGSLVVPTITTPMCIGFHTFIHYLIERKWKD